MSGTIHEFPDSRHSKAFGLSGQLADALAKNEVVEAITTPGAGEQEAANIPGGTEAVSVAPALPPLHELEEGLMALLDSEALVTPEQEEAFLQELSTAMQTTKVKRDRVAGFIKECEFQSAYCREEIGRMQARQRRLDNASDRVRNYVLWIINALDVKKLEGEKFTFGTSKLKPKLEIVDEALISPDFKTATIQVPAEWLTRYLVLLGELGLKLTSSSVKFNVDSAKLKEALEGAPVECEVCGGVGVQAYLPDSYEEPGFDPARCTMCGGSGVVPPSVPGAKLITDRKTLVLR